MATTYKKNARNVYKIPFYVRLWFWYLILILIACLLFLILHVKQNNVLVYLLIFIMLLVAILTIWRAYSLVKRVIKAESIGKFWRQSQAEKAVKKSLLATMSVNRLQDTPFIAVPDVTVIDKSPSYIKVELEKLAGMYEIDRLKEDINSSFRKSLSQYAVVSSMITQDGLFYKFVLEDVATDKTWRPVTFEDLQAKNHEIKLQNDLIINLADSPHIIIWGKSGSGKSTVLIAIIAQLLTSGADLRIIDGKTEFSALSEFYPSEKIVNDISVMFEMLYEVVEEIKKRQKIVADGVRKYQKMGLRAYDLGLKPIVVLADEIGSIVASLDSKQKKEFMGLFTQIVQKGRSVSVFAIVATQSPKVETTLSSDIRQQFATKILLGSANGDIQRMAFDGEIATKGSTERFRGYYMSDGKTEQPMMYYVPDLHSYNLNDLNILKKL